ncbi:cryptococcal mannosyltransferase 1-domain-containing protein [Haematococcus lacustris]
MAAGVPHTITAAGQLSRLGAERIHFLAKVRNTALLPLWHSKHHSGGFPAQRIVFLNDVWFCHQDVVRLAQYRTADIACGLDFDRYAPRRHLMRALRDTSLVPPLPSAPETLGAGAALRWAEQQTRRLQAQGTRGGAGAGGVGDMGGSTGVGADTAGLEHLLAALQEALGCEPDIITPPSHTPSSSPMASTSPPWPRQSTPGQNHSLSPSNVEDWAGDEDKQRLWALLREVQSRLNISSQAAAETAAAGSSWPSTSSSTSSATSSASSSASSVTSVDGGAGQGHGLWRAGARQLLGQSPWLAFYDTW